MRVENFVNSLNCDFYTGVPDSQLKPLCDYLVAQHGATGKRHVIAANEGNSVAMAAGYYLSTGRYGVVYLQNSGIGNIINPVTSLMSDEIYGIPCIYVVGWRGEPGVHDEPQHSMMGRISVQLLEDVGIKTLIVGKKTTPEWLKLQIENWQPHFVEGRSLALLIQKNALENVSTYSYTNSNTLSREDVIEHIVNFSGKDILISTTGKTSRELFEIRTRRGEPHSRDFLTVGSMGHTSSIALSVAMQKDNRRVWCIDGDGAVLMHMGSMAIIGSLVPANFIHVVINNESHETVGGMPTAAGKIDLCGIAQNCGYNHVFSVGDANELDGALENVKQAHGICFIEARTSIGSRIDLGRPTQSSKESKIAFMENLRHG